MLIFTYDENTSLGCIDLTKVKYVCLKDVDYDDDTARIIFDDIDKWFNLGSVIMSSDENGKDVSITLKKLLEFEKQVIAQYNYKTLLPLLIVRYCVLNPKCSFADFVKREYLELEQGKIEQAIDSLPDLAG